MNRLFIVGVFLMVILFSACETESSSDVNQDRIFTTFSLSYDGETDVSTVKARFRFGNATGTLLELEPPSQVNANGEELPYNSTLAQYSKTYSGFVSAADFVWEDTEGRVYENRLMIKAIEFPEMRSISRDAAFELVWKGDALKADESVSLWLTDSEGKGSAVFMQNAEGSTSIILPKDELQELSAGEAEFEMARGISSDLSDPTEAGGVLKGDYRCTPIKVILE